MPSNWMKFIENCMTQPVIDSPEWSSTWAKKKMNELCKHDNLTIQKYYTFILICVPLVNARNFYSILCTLTCIIISICFLFISPLSRQLLVKQCFFLRYETFFPYLLQFHFFHVKKSRRITKIMHDVMWYKKYTHAPHIVYTLQAVLQKPSRRNICLATIFLLEKKKNISKKTVHKTSNEGKKK